MHYSYRPGCLSVWVLALATDKLVADMVTGLGAGMLVFALVMILVRD
ncbi:MAG: hypothetical protein Q7J73_09780 [Dehalococcoidales bacterium]|nr:hypothetical protein [Dehalococcoidales bacterium]